MRQALAGAVLLGLLTGYGASRVEAKVEYTKKEGKSCVVCHTKNGTKELNDVGRCYEKSKTLKGCLPDDKDKKQPVK